MRSSTDDELPPLEGDTPAGPADEVARTSRRRFLLGGTCVLCAAIGATAGRLSAPRRAATVVTPLEPGTTIAPPTTAAAPTLTQGARAEAQPDALFRIRTEEKVVALTFDDGPDPAYTPTVLDLLQRTGAHATFFVVGVNALAHEDLLAGELEQGHSIGNHTYDHRELELLTPDEVDWEIEQGRRAIERAGSPRPKMFRPPKGYTDEAVGVLADALRYRTVFWDLCVERFVDHHGIETGTRRLADRVKPGSVILAHDGGHIAAAGHPVINRQKTMESLPRLIDRLQRDGYEIVDVPTLLRRTGHALLPLPPAAPAVPTPTPTPTTPAS